LGISQAAIICHLSIQIGNNVKIGGGARIYDTDFHAIDPKLRLNPITDFANKVKIPVVIEDNVFIGAHSTILKGVTIGQNSIIGACSVVTKNVPLNEIWAGNPAKFIRNVK
jgi:acetyltransferase-like isoleucine patch superfamily enzyme